MTQKEKVLTAALFRCACTLAHAAGKMEPPERGISDLDRYETETAVAIAAMNLSLADAKAETELWLSRMERAYQAYLLREGPELTEFDKTGGIMS